VPNPFVVDVREAVLTYSEVPRPATVEVIEFAVLSILEK
jgi:hypothetical protein